MFENYQIIDITPLISETMAVFPGDKVFKRSQSMSTKSGDHITLSSIETTLHLGAHADATNHYHSKGKGIETKDLLSFMGECQVVQVSIERSKRITLNDFKLENVNCKRVLFKTNSFPDPNSWNDDFNSLSPEVINALAQKGVILVGIDTPSVDPKNSKELESHLSIFKNNLSILEGIVLDKADEGVYQLIALPLKIKDADASPVRAILLRDREKLC